MADYERWTVEQDEKNNGGDKPSVNIHIYTQADHPVCTAAAAALHTWPGIIMLMLENEVSHETKQHTHTHSLDSVTVSVIFFFFCIRLSAFGPHCVRAFIHGQRQGMCNIWFYVPCHHYLMYIFIHLFCFSLSLLFFQSVLVSAAVADETVAWREIGGCTAVRGWGFPGNEALAGERIHKSHSRSADWFQGTYQVACQMLVSEQD